MADKLSMHFMMRFVMIQINLKILTFCVVYMKLATKI